MSTNNSRVLLWLFLLMLIPYSVVLAKSELPDVISGLWQVDAKIMMASMVVKEYSIQRCFIRETMRPENISHQDKCKMASMSLQTHRARWAMSCEYLGIKMQGLGDIHFQKKSFSGDFNMTVSNSQMGGLALQTKLSGRYLGGCPRIEN